MQAARDSSEAPRRAGAGAGTPGGGRGPLCGCAPGSAGEPAGLLPRLPHASRSVRKRPCRRTPASPSALRPYTDSKARCPCSPPQRPQAAGAAKGACSHESLGRAHGATIAAPPKPPTAGLRPPRRALRDRRAQASCEGPSLPQQNAGHAKGAEELCACKGKAAHLHWDAPGAHLPGTPVLCGVQCRRSVGQHLCKQYSSRCDQAGLPPQQYAVAGVCTAQHAQPDCCTFTGSCAKVTKRTHTSPRAHRQA
jgi:hypothetical protein